MLQNRMQVHLNEHTDGISFPVKTYFASGYDSWCRIKGPRKQLKRGRVCMHLWASQALSLLKGIASLSIIAEPAGREVGHPSGLRREPCIKCRL